MPEQANDKATVRSRFVNDRSTVGNHRLREASQRIMDLLLLAPELRRARTVCAYWSFGTEPDTRTLISELADRDVRVLLPVLLPDGDLDWAAYAGESGLAAGRLGLSEPGGPRLGPGAILGADAVLVPALAVSATGQRLGRGGGSYDRALARLAMAGTDPDPVPPPWTCALVYDGELDAAVPVESHDRPVDAACAPGRLVRFTAPRRAMTAL
jgi:5-formyltetrahydrofolate cyclo-ligase